MLVPSHVEELNKANVSLGQTAGYQAIPRKTPLFSHAGSIELEGGNLGDGRLHAKGHLILSDP
jgi:hypothetical protein